MADHNAFEPPFVALQWCPTSRKRRLTALRFALVVALTIFLVNVVYERPPQRLRVSTDAMEGKKATTVSLIPNLWFDGDCKKALEFYPKAFPCKTVFEMDMEGTVIHSCVMFGESKIYANDVYGELDMNPENGAKKGCSATMNLDVANCDKVIEKAVAAGCKLLKAPEDYFWGARMGKVMDPFGHTWAISHRLKEPSEEDLTKGRDAWWSMVKKGRKRKDHPTSENEPEKKK
mmetsp:Transcript_4674/g.6963  ORF Transcript_4674/g.6963 Transcript_4674/m.6963 type:complete len:232 (-) Transcript_4674:202-897(-)